MFPPNLMSVLKSWKNSMKPVKKLHPRTVKSGWIYILVKIEKVMLVLRLWIGLMTTIIKHNQKNGLSKKNLIA